MVSTTSLVLFILFHLFLLHSAESKCPRSFPCQNLILEFLLSDTQPECGLFTVNCTFSLPRLKLQAGDHYYEVLNNISLNQLFVRDPFLQNILNERSCFAFSNLSLPITPLSSFKVSPTLTMLACFNGTESELHRNQSLRSFEDCPGYIYYYRNPSYYTDNEINFPEVAGCSEIQVPIISDLYWSEFNMERLSASFTLEWNITDDCMECHERGGECSTNNMNQEYFCRTIPGKNMAYVIFSGVTFGLVICLGIYFCFREKMIEVIQGRREDFYFRFHKTKTESHMEIELFFMNNEHLAPQSYKYSDLKKITNSFSDRLGKGGFSSVYKGKLQDGCLDRLAAVKILNESKGSGEEFMNEVASISRTSHVNIVTLLGFCFENSRRALIYEFMPNGSLEKFLHNTASSTEEGRLGWEKLFEIIIGIARGLEYLHQGCKTRILHLDIKPHNILLDKDLIPKISDFGLAKLCPDRASIISMVGARGTIGYIAPEIFCRNFGDVSHKSDVYSFGMLMLEMVGGTKNVDAGAERSSDIYFPDWIYKKLEVNANEGADEIGDENEAHALKRKLTIIGLWCIQTDPNHRPSITRVVEMLEENVESIQIPPRPYLFSPAKLQVETDVSRSFASSS